MTDLSVLIPSRNELFLKNTIEDILAHMRGDTEVIAVLDGQWADPPINDHPLVTLIYYPEAVGQRAATNAAAKIARGRYVMKCDAHCAFDEGFDVKMLEVIQPDWTMVPIMRNLHTFDWVCPNGHRRYQGPSGPCTECGEPTTRDVVWIAKPSPQSKAYCFDATPHFQYFSEFNHRPEGKGDLTETMSLQGSCWMISREKYFELEVCDESWGTWGSQGIEVACKTWLSGGRVMVNHKTWYAHQFRTQGGDFSFPYPLSGRQTEAAKKTAKRVFFVEGWPKQKRPLSWLVEKFWPVPGWTESDLNQIKDNREYREIPEIPHVVRQLKGVVYYTNNLLDPLIMQACQQQLVASTNGHEIISVSSQPVDLGKNITTGYSSGYLSMFQHILIGLEQSTAEIVFFAEHDILYPPSHFEFMPPDPTKVYYNMNVWKVDYGTGHALHYDCKQTMAICAYRDVLLKHYTERVKRTAAKFAELGDTREYRNWIREQGFEPGTHGRAERVDDLTSGEWWSAVPIIDIRHNSNLTPSRWRQDQFRNARSCRNWQEADTVQAWGYPPGKFREFLEEIN